LIINNKDIKIIPGRIKFLRLSVPETVALSKQILAVSKEF